MDKLERRERDKMKERLHFGKKNDVRIKNEVKDVL